MPKDTGNRNSNKTTTNKRKAVEGANASQRSGVNASKSTPRHSMLHAKHRQGELSAFSEAGHLPAALQKDKYFIELQKKLFNSLTPVSYATAKNIVHHQNEMTEKQKYDLADVGETFAASIPFEFLSDRVSAQKAYQTCVNGISRLIQNFNASPKLTSLMGKPLLNSFEPFHTFLNEAIPATEHSHLSENFKHPLVRGMKGAVRALEQLNLTIKKGSALAEPFKVMDTLSHLDHFKQSFQLGFFKSVMPISGVIVQVLISLHDVMTPEQRTELADIGKSFVTTVFDLITARRTPEECFQAVEKNFKRLENFLVNAPELLLKAGASFLENILPLGKFLRKFSEEVTKSDLPSKPKASLTKAVEHATTAVEGFQAAIGPHPAFGHPLP